MGHSIGKTIAELRKEKGWTQIELAEKLQVSDKAVSKWEQEGGIPSVEFFPVLAEVFGVSIDYLMTGKKVDNVNLDDMDATKRMYYLIEKDDAENYIKYGHVKKTYFDDFPKGAENTPISCIIKNNSFKIFNACVNAGITLKPNNYSASTFVGALYEHIDELVKLACLSGSIQFLEKIDIRSFGVGNKASQLRNNSSVKIIHSFFNHTYDKNTAYLISDDVFDFIYNDKRVPESVVEYISTYIPFNSKKVKVGTSVADYGRVNGIFYFLEQNIITALYSTGRFELLNKYIEAIQEDSLKTINAYNNKGSDYSYHIGYKVTPSSYLIRTDTGSYGVTTILGKFIAISQGAIQAAINKSDKEWISIFNNYNKSLVGKINSSLSFTAYVLTDSEVERHLLLNSDISEGEKLKVKCMNCEGIISLSTLKNSIINLARVGIDKSDKVSCLDKLIKLVKKYVPSILFNAPITYYELLSSFLKENNYKALFKFAVDYGFTDLANELMRSNSDKIERIIEEKFLFTQAELQPYKEICEKIIAKRAQYSNKAPTPYYFSQLEESKHGIYERILLNKCKQVEGTEFVEAYKKLLIQQMENIPLENLNVQNANLAYFKDEKTAFYNNWLNSLEKEYEEITHAKAMAEAHQKVMSEITKEYLLDLLKQENKEVLVIKLCVKLESILRNKFHYDGEFNEMINSLHSIKVTCQEDDGWGYMVDKEVEKYSSEMFEDFYKLRMARNSIVHASIGGVEIEMNVLKRCINWIESL